MFVGKGQIEHYKNIGNYTELKGTVIDYRSERFMQINDIDEENYSNISLWSFNIAEIESSNFWEEINIGDTVYVFTTDGYFWDGYNRPIVALRTDSKVYLDFDTGKQNLIEELIALRQRYLCSMIPVLCLMCLGFISSFILVLVQANIRKINRKNPSTDEAN